MVLESRVGNKIMNHKILPKNKGASGNGKRKPAVKNHSHGASRSNGSHSKRTPLPQQRTYEIA